MAKLLYIKLTPNAKVNKIDGYFTDEGGLQHLKVYTTAIPEDGKANNDLIKLIAKEYKIPKSSITLIKGNKSRFKVLEIKE